MKTKKKIQPISSVNIILPKRWGELTDEQLLYYYFLRASQYTDISVQSYCFFRWSGIKILGRLRNSVYVEKKIDGRKRQFYISKEDIHFAVKQLDFLSDEKPKEVIQLQRLGSYYGVNKYLQQVPFRNYLVCENNYQGYIHSKKEKYIESLARLLYQKKTFFGKLKPVKKIKLNERELMAVIGWWYSFKLYISYKFNYLFTEGKGGDIEDSMNGQIRALTAGDATKEKEVFELDTWRALTELNEKAREVKELKQRYEE